MADVQRPAGLSGGQRAAVGVPVTLGVGLAAYGVAGSYQTVSGLAERRGVPLTLLVPVGTDGGLIGVVVFDLVLSWIGQPIGWLRQFVRVLTVGTVAANAAAGWPDLVAAGLHVAAPLMLLAMVEAGRTVLLRRIGGPDGPPRDRIPVARWLLAPWPTWLMWRRMVLWQAGSFRTAVEAEQERRQAVVLLRVRYGRRWRRQAPPELVWMLQSGVSAHDAVARARVVAAVEGTGSGQDMAYTAGETSEADMSADVRTSANGHAAGRKGGRARTPGEAAASDCGQVRGSRVRQRKGGPRRSANQGRQAAGRRAGHDRGGPGGREASLLTGHNAAGRRTAIANGHPDPTVS